MRIYIGKRLKCCRGGPCVRPQIIKGCGIMKFLFILGIILAMCGVILIFDARPITKKMFGFGDQNDATLGLKLFGYLIAIIGMVLIFFNK